MPAKSKSQQRFMGMVHAVQKGELSPSKVSDKVKDAAKSMKKKDAEDFASTKHKGKPEKVAKEVIRKVSEIIRQEVESCGYTMSAENPKRKLKSPGGTGPEDRDLKEGKRATKGFDKVYKTRRDFLISWGDFRKKLGDMGTDPRIFKLEGELYKFELKFVKESAKIMQFMQKLAKSKITEGKINEIDNKMKITKTKLREIIREEIQKLSEKSFVPTVTLTKYDKEFKKETFKTEIEAKKFVKKMKAQYKLTRQRGFWGNPKNGIELTTNY